MDLPPKLNTIVRFFEQLPEDEKRENLIAYSRQVRHHEPRSGERFDFEEVRKDRDCTDTVGIHLRLDPGGGLRLAMTLGPEVQTLTRALAVILCKGLDGASPETISALPTEFIRRIVGSELVRTRSRSIYYLLGRVQSACRELSSGKRV